MPSNIGLQNAFALSISPVATNPEHGTVEELSDPAVTWLCHVLAGPCSLVPSPEVSQVVYAPPSQRQTYG
ncbi:MAG: hypothetical protein KVP17_000703 [Porospora cf. gigantea B]|uniref:uncharacterized protein n=1 Tax=Porospora cf. gigantea B TaxID=2853592 RepID=UPI003571E503|nr:MAG: hypothetical protein KVP17_000703 [Porospora cf. gigantea B]